MIVFGILVIPGTSLVIEQWKCRGTWV